MISRRQLLYHTALNSALLALTPGAFLAVAWVVSQLIGGGW